MILEKGLRTLKGKVKQHKIFGFDVETCNNNKTFVCAAIFGDKFKKFYTDLSDLKYDLATNRVFRGSFICATNLGFDISYLFPIKDLLEKCFHIERASGIILVKTYVSYDANDENFYSQQVAKQIAEDKGKKLGQMFYIINFIDSGNHLQNTVENLGKIIKLEKLKCDFIGKMPSNEEEWGELKKYNVRDAEITYRFMVWLQEKYNDIGCKMNITISSTALDLFRRKYHSGFWKQEDRDKILFQYKGYYGGRTEALKRGLFSAENYGKIKVYDANSLYPYCLRNFQYPIPNGTMYNKVTSEQIENYEGVCEIELQCPYMYLPYLPVRTDKLRFPVGKIKGVYDFNSIRQAVKTGYEIISVGKGIVYEHKFAPFKKYVDDLYKLRNELKLNKDSSQIVAKILMNSFYGKFGYNFSNKEKIVHGKELISLDLDKYEIFPYGGKEQYFRISTTESSNIPGYVFPIIPLYVTSYARQTMFKYYKNTGFEKVFYTDTDCIFTTRQLETSNDLGALKLEHTFDKCCIVKPKFYGGVTTNNNEIIKIKGLHGSIKQFQFFVDLIKSGDFKVERKHFTKFRTALSGKRYMNEVYTMVKEMNFNEDKRLWEKKLFSLNPQDSRPCILE